MTKRLEHGPKGGSSSVILELALADAADGAAQAGGTGSTTVRAFSIGSFFSHRTSAQSSAPGRGTCTTRSARSLPPTGTATVIIALKPTKASITGQIAVKISLDAVFHRLDSLADAGQLNDAPEIVREAYKAANTEVYAYAHRMGAGGVMGASALVVAFDGTRMCIGRAGEYEGYVLRGESPVALFASQGSADEPHPQKIEGVLTRFLGANAQVLVDLATTTVQEDDLVLLSTKSIPVERLLSFPRENLRCLSTSTLLEAMSKHLDTSTDVPPGGSVFLLLRFLRPTMNQQSGRRRPAE